jgi:hypothetical protein
MNQNKSSSVKLFPSGICNSKEKSNTCPNGKKMTIVMKIQMEALELKHQRAHMELCGRPTGMRPIFFLPVPQIESESKGKSFQMHLEPTFHQRYINYFR